MEEVREHTVNLAALCIVTAARKGGIAAGNLDGHYLAYITSKIRNKFTMDAEVTELATKMKGILEANNVKIGEE